MAFVPAPGCQTVFNPPIPFTTTIAGGLRPSMGVTILATLEKSHNRFTVNLMTGETEASDIAMQMCARYDGADRVIFNTKRNGAWEKEEVKKQMPFKSGKQFIILFELTSNNYLVFVNGERFYEYEHRVSTDQVKWINVSGDIVVHALDILGVGPGTKGNMALIPAQVNLPPMMGPCYFNPTVPFKAQINGGFGPKRTVVICGVPTGKNFSINLKNGFSTDIPFHMNPRLNKGTLVRNSCIGNQWGKEELEVPKNPFKQGDYFSVSIRSGGTKYKVFINGSFSFEYESRMGSLNQVDTIEVGGTIMLAYVFL
ncbi:galectin-4 [Gastrophryne carolinensis]